MSPVPIALDDVDDDDNDDSLQQHAVNGAEQVPDTLRVASVVKTKGRILQGGPAKVKPLTFLLVTVECIGKIQ